MTGGLVSPGEIVRSGLCIGCGSCASAAPDATMRWDAYRQLKPDGPRDWLERRDAGFSATCPFSPTAANEDTIATDRLSGAPETHPLLGRFESAWVGHVAEGGYREGGSSGGLVTWVAAELMRQGLVDGVAHVGPRDVAGEGRYFGFGISRDLDAVRAGARSRYYPVHMADVLAEIRATPGRYAVVGVPCFIKAVQLLRRRDPVIAERVAFTLGLFCGHMKSGELVDSFAWQLGVDPASVTRVEYRRKDPDRPANWYTAHLDLADGQAVWQDWWHLADGDWGAGFFQNAACNWCDDVVAETADIAFGDAWVEPYSSDGRGSNVAITRSPVLDGIVRAAVGDGRLGLTQVDADFIVGTQAAGFRQRREGLAYRLTWRKRGLRPVKRVAPSSAGIVWRRRLVYRTRAAITRWSHRLHWLARRTSLPALYLRPARAALGFYAAVTWSRGRLGAMFDRLERRG